MNKTIQYIFLICVSFCLFFVFKKLWFSDIFHGVNNSIKLYPLSFFLSYLIVGIPVFLFVLFTEKSRSFRALGLRFDFLKAMLISFIFALPMFIGYGLIANFEIDIPLRSFWFGCVFAAFFEELYYRGFFFGLLFRNTKLGFFPALIISALVFASLHLYQSEEIPTLIGIFITTLLGAGLFAWLYVEWNFNLWVPIGLHFFMNLSWEMFNISDNAFGDLYANIIRALTIIFAVVGTIIYKKRNQMPLAVNRNTLIMKSENSNLHL